MKELVATVQSDAENASDLRSTEAGGPPSAAEPGARFAYPSGSKPLAGYVIKRGVGHGGFGEVYYATSDAGKEVALKLIRRNLEIELRGIRQCLNLKHPNLLSLFDIRNDERGDSWVVMEYVSGECLQDAIAAHPKGMAVHEVIAWFHGIASGVAYLHDHGIVHRDLKPGNLFSDEGIVKIGDYGLSKFISCSRRSGQTESVGTVHYMAPEVANGRYGKEIDIYALGIILYEMLTGRVPFEGESVGEVLMKHLTAEPDVSVLAEPYRNVVARALEKDPNKRFKSVPEMLARLPRPPGVGPGAVTGRLPSGARPPKAAAGPLGDTAPAVDVLPVVEVVDEEPIFRALRHFCVRMYYAWNESNLNTPTKIVLIVVVAFALLATANVLIPLGVVLLALYGGYRLVRMVVLAANPPAPRPAGAACAPPQVVPPARLQPVAAPELHPRCPGAGSPFHPRWARPHDRPVEALVQRTPAERVTELVGSLLGGALVAITMCVVVVILHSFHNQIPHPEQCAWLVLMSIVGTWAVLVASKFWEGTQGEPMLRRFILLVVGLGVGVLAFEVAELLMVKMAVFPPPARNYELPASFYDRGEPLLPAFLACFGTLFVVIRWWRQGDPLRATRLSLWATFVCVVLAALVAAAWQFPQPWLPMMAGVISVSVQLSSPWLHPRRRLTPVHA